jgi:hypothetical protein
MSAYGNHTMPWRKLAMVNSAAIEPAKTARKPLKWTSAVSHGDPS